VRVDRRAREAAVTQALEDVSGGITQLVYYSERLLIESGPLPQDRISYHLVEDAGTDPKSLARKMVENTLRCYIDREHFGEYQDLEAGGSQAETPPEYTTDEYNFETVVRDPFQTEFPRLLDDIYPTGVDPTEIVVDSDDRQHELQMKVGERLLDKNLSWSWTKKAAFIEYLLSNTDAIFHIPREQIDTHEFGDIIHSLLYWAFVAYFNGNSTVADDPETADLTDIPNRAFSSP
jgi:hypothetical protein